MNLSLAVCALVMTMWVSAQIDSGGGKATIGSMNNHGSIGGSVSTGVFTVGANTNRNGLIEVLYSGESSLYDANSNGLPDSWEQVYFPGQLVDPLADPDGDGTTNRMEYIAGTNPTNRNSFFKPVGTYTSGIFSMPIQTVAGRTYKVYATKDLSNWYLQQGYTGDGSSKTFTFDETAIPIGPLHSNTHPSKYFFRVEVILP